MADPLDLCNEKIKRAEARLDELKREVFAFFQGDEPYEIPGDYDPETKTFTFTLDVRDPPAVIDAIIGEIAHGLRSALNNLIVAVSGTADGNIDFPIFVDETEFMRKGKKRIVALRPEHEAAVECLQPYQRRDPHETPLAIINRLARIDKHREGTFKVFANVFGDYHFNAIRDIASYGHAHLYYGVMKQGDPLAKIEIIPSGPQPELRIQANLRAGVAFGERWTLPAPFPRLIAEVRDIVEAFTVFP